MITRQRCRTYVSGVGVSDVHISEGRYVRITSSPLLGIRCARK